jgi:hypothetical protein
LQIVLILDGLMISDRSWSELLIKTCINNDSDGEYKYDKWVEYVFNNWHINIINDKLWWYEIGIRVINLK